MTSTRPTTHETTVLDAGTVEARGRFAEKKDEIASEIESFLQSSTSVDAEVRCLWTIFLFVTTLPGPSSITCHPGYLMKGMSYFPVVGSLVGLMVAVVFDFGHDVLGLPAILAAVLSTAASFRWTGCLHEDGLADSADGIGGGWNRPQILRIMTDTRLGTFGSAALILYVFGKLQVLGLLDTSHWQLYKCHGAGPALLIGHTLSRWTAPYLIHQNVYVEEDGPKSNFYSFMIRAKFLVSLPRVIMSTAWCVALTTLLYGPGVALCECLLMWLCAEFGGYYGRYKLGGVMGDYLGAVTCITELSLLMFLLVSTRPHMIQNTALHTLYLEIKEIMEEEAKHDNAKDYYQMIASSFSTVSQNSKVQSFLRFLIGAVVFFVWEGVMTRTSATVKSTKLSLHDERTSTNNEYTLIPKNDVKEKSTASREAVLSSPHSTFSEKYDICLEYLDTLAKPVGSLGTLEEWAARMCSLQGTMQPSAYPVACIIFAADHGVAASLEDGGEGCSLYPQDVTRAILAGLQKGVAGASVLARNSNVSSLVVVDVGVAVDKVWIEGPVVTSSKHKLKGGTQNFCLQDAMSVEETDRCIRIGRDSFRETLHKTGCKVLALGEVGIGNTTTASAIIAALTGEAIASVCSGGAYASRTADPVAIQKKIMIVTKALEKHKESLLRKNPAMVLSKVGGAEIAALVGAILEASDHPRGIALLIDGFIVTAAALVAVSMKPSVCNALFLSTKSAEQGQMVAISYIQSIARHAQLPVPSDPVLSMGLRMGEGTGALLAVPILQGAAAMIKDTATIQEILFRP